MAESMTELDVVVGSMITTRPDEDRETYEEERSGSRMYRSYCAKKASKSTCSRSRGPKSGRVALAASMTSTSSGGSPHT